MRSRLATLVACCLLTLPLARPARAADTPPVAFHLSANAGSPTPVPGIAGDFCISTPAGGNTTYLYLCRRADGDAGFDGLSIYDITSGVAEHVGDWIAPADSRVLAVTVNAANTHAFVTNGSAGGSNGSGVYLLDITNKSTPDQVRGLLGVALTIGTTDTQNAIGIWLDESQPSSPVLYVGSQTDAGCHHPYTLWDVSTLDAFIPTAPTEIGPGMCTGDAHEATVVKPAGAPLTCFASAGTANIHVFDMSNDASPVEIAQAVYGGGGHTYYTHTSWPTPDARYLYTTEEWDSTASHATGGSFRVWDISGIYAAPYPPPAPRALTQIASWQSDRGGAFPPGADTLVAIHKCRFFPSDSTLLTVSYYQDGVRILDVSDPRTPVEVGYYRTYTGPTLALMSEGCIMAQAVTLPGGTAIVASDATNGIYVLNFDGTRGGTLTGAVTDSATGLPIPGATVSIAAADRHVLADGNGAYVLCTAAGNYTVDVSAPLYYPKSLSSVAVSAGATTPLSVTLARASTDARGTTPPDATAATQPRVWFTPAPGGGWPAAYVKTAAPARVSLAVYDTRGRRVAAVGDYATGSGVTALPWSGATTRATIATGVFLWRASVDGMTFGGKFAVVR